MTPVDECQRRIARGNWAEDAIRQQCHFPVGPRNTWSNAAYPLVGIALVLLDPSPWSRTFAVCMLALGLGSGAYHGMKTLWSNSMDWAGMYVVFTALTLHGIAPQALLIAWLTVPLAAIVAWQFAYRLGGVGLNAHMGLFLGLSLIPPLLRGVWLWAAAGFGTFLVAYAIWQLDQRRSRLTGVWGHAVWHVLTAVAIGLVFWAQAQT